ncbi:Rhamnan synthesis protein F [Succinivibrio dextrinosolvens DSM 3072]|uniref:Rhamnan synthesis protein F n=1 Tax=Succinivibrio dextrinosolvens DSM 3072 TaxID=1123324 RepID=A0A1T4VBM8_9GAMM|nr:rhamnan synthesis F family protein [Succinivibrio dextrinosolvens]SKA62346.1 Rhamnan synthesis protein F [Succinivibrio dextrinosolvens DSM 3072]
MSEKVLVVVHIFYPILWRQIKHCISNLDKLYIDYDLVVSIPQELNSFSKNIYTFNNRAVVIVSENVGYDIWPFIKVLNNVELDNYDYIIKLHTKRGKGFEVSSIRNKYYFMGSSWRNLLISFISNKCNLKKTFLAFENDPLLGMVNNGKLIDVNEISCKDEHFSFCAKKAIECVNRLIKYDSEFVEFVAGSMFICRAKLFKPLQSFNFQLKDFSSANRDEIDDLAHVLERVFGGIISAQGYKISDPYSTLTDNVLFFFYSQFCRFLSLRAVKKIIRFIFRVDGCYNEDKIIRIFKIKVFKIKKRL